MWQRMSIEEFERMREQRLRSMFHERVLSPVREESESLEGAEGPLPELAVEVVPRRAPRDHPPEFYDALDREVRALLRSASTGADIHDSFDYSRLAALEETHDAPAQRSARASPLSHSRDFSAAGADDADETDAASHADTSREGGLTTVSRESIMADDQDAGNVTTDDDLVNNQEAEPSLPEATLQNVTESEGDETSDDDVGSSSIIFPTRATPRYAAGTAADGEAPAQSAAQEHEEQDEDPARSADTTGAAGGGGHELLRPAQVEVMRSVEQSSPRGSLDGLGLAACRDSLGGLGLAARRDSSSLVCTEPPWAACARMEAVGPVASPEASPRQPTPEAAAAGRRARRRAHSDPTPGRARAAKRARVHAGTQTDEGAGPRAWHEVRRGNEFYFIFL